jgi:hypothetical protein
MRSACAAAGGHHPLSSKNASDCLWQDCQQPAQLTWGGQCTDRCRCAALPHLLVGLLRLLLALPDLLLLRRLLPGDRLRDLLRLRRGLLLPWRLLGDLLLLLDLLLCLRGLLLRERLLLLAGDLLPLLPLRRGLLLLRPRLGDRLDVLPLVLLLCREGDLPDVLRGERLLLRVFLTSMSAVASRLRMESAAARPASLASTPPFIAGSLCTSVVCPPSWEGCDDIGDAPAMLSTRPAGSTKQLLLSSIPAPL